MAPKIKHVIVLMLENRSFDQMLGYLKTEQYPIDGLTGHESNPLNLEPGAKEISVYPGATDILVHDPGHEHGDVNVQLYENSLGPPPVEEPNRGFVFSYGQQPHVTPEIAPQIMSCFSGANLPVLSALAQEFAICDHWYSSMPGPTWPNRFFAHCATSKGNITNGGIANYDMPTVFEQLTAKGLTWKIYFHDFVHALLLTRLSSAENVVNFAKFSNFARDAKQGRLPNYSFIEPRYFDGFGAANDQHPPHSVARGEALIADVYKAAQSTNTWAESLLVLVYDEHGGTYDHVTPPPAPPPDEHTSQFAFDRYGVRVPAVLISPFIRKGTIVSEPLDHTSIIATLRENFGLGGPLTHRDRDANSFLGALDLAAARTDPQQVEARLGGSRVAPQAKRLKALAGERYLVSSPISDLQRAMVDATQRITGVAPTPLRAEKPVVAVNSERTAGQYVERAIDVYLTRKQTHRPGARRRLR
jgi:phospholipase C